MQERNEALEVALSTGKIMFFYFINNLVTRKLASINKVNGNIINIDAFASNWFIIGRSVEDDKLENPFIGIPEDMIPWFLEMNWKRVLIDYTGGFIYLTCSDDATIPNFTIRLKARTNRLNVFKSLSENDGVDFRIFQFDGSGDVVISKKVYKRCKINEFDGIESVTAFHEDDLQRFENDKTVKKYGDDNNYGLVAFFDD